MTTYSSQRVTYDTNNHLSILTQLHGSVWPKVLPHCFLNIANVWMIILVNKYLHMNLSYSDKGHTFLSTIVSFLLVTRSNVTHSRYMEARSGLSAIMRSCRELVQYAVTFTRYDTSDAAKQWRYNLCKKTITLLRSVVCVTQFESATDKDVWKTPALNEEETEQLKKIVEDEQIRIPMILTMFLRTSIASHEKDEPGADGEPMKTLHVNRELKLFALVSSFVESYHVLSRLIDTQFPFPLAQMNRTFVFVWVYSLPWVLYNDDIRPTYLCFITVFITFAFVGLECVSIELDDPFGEDPNDFDVLKLAEATFHDIYTYLKDIDGEEEAKRLSQYFDPKDTTNENSDCVNETTPLKTAGSSYERFPTVSPTRHSSSAHEDGMPNRISTGRRVHSRNVSSAVGDDLSYHRGGQGTSFRTSGISRLSSVEDNV